MVAAVWILSCTGFSAYFHIAQIGKTTSTTGNCHTHAFCHGFEVLAVDMRLMAREFLGFEYGVLNLLDYVRCHVPTTVGYGGSKIGYL